MREATTAIVTIIVLPLLPLLLLLNIIPKFKRIPKWIWDHVYNSHDAFDMRSFLFFFFLFIVVIGMLFNPAKWPPSGPDWDPTTEVCDGRHPC